MCALLGARGSHQRKPGRGYKDSLRRSILCLAALSAVAVVADKPCREIIVVEGAGLEVGPCLCNKLLFDERVDAGIS